MTDAIADDDDDDPEFGTSGPPPAVPLTDAYLTKAERDARRFQGAWTGTAGNLAAHVMRLLGEIRRLKAQAPTPPLVEAINRQTAVMVEGMNPANDRFLYVSQDPYGQRFQRNPLCWLNRVSNLTCFSPAQLSGTPWHQRAGTLVTRKHVVYASHFGVPVIEGGTPIFFVDRNSNVVQRRVMAQVADHASDIAIGVLDSEVPDTIAIAPVMPPDHERYLGFQRPFLVVTLDSEEKASLQQCNSIFQGGFSSNTLGERYVAPELQRLAAWSESTVVGDSGNPVFAVVYGELVLLGCWWTAMGGPHLGSRHELVNMMIEQLSPGEGYRLTSKAL